jgi:hypothetical protein
MNRPVHSLVTIPITLSRLLDLKSKGAKKRTGLKKGPVGGFCTNGDADLGFMKFDVFSTSLTFQEKFCAVELFREKNRYL